MRNDNELCKMKRLCQKTIQEFWFQQKELKDVLRVYGIEKTDASHDSVTKLLLKTRKDFINGFSFFTKEGTDDKIVRLVQKHDHRCMRG
jgi:hypothetical protein